MQAVESANAAEETLDHLTEVLSQAWLVERETKSIKLQFREIMRPQDDEMSPSTEQSQQLTVLDARTTLIKGDPK